MCYTGLCKYEITSGQFAGECTVLCGDYPDDAGCIQAEREQEEEAREKALSKEIE